MGLAAIAAVAQGIGTLVGGNKRAGEARVARRAVDAKMAEAIAYAKRKNRKVAEGGSPVYDLKRLRDDALAAGFNPLTVLQMTGGQGYDAQSLASPFGDVASMMVRRAELVGQMSGAVIEHAGYFGDALSAGAGAYVNQRNLEIANVLDAARTKAIASVGKGSTSFGGAGGVASPFSPAPKVETTAPGKLWSGVVDFFGGMPDYFGRGTTVEDVSDKPATGVLTTPRGTQIPVLNNDFFEEGPVAWVNGMWGAGALAVDEAWHRTYNLGWALSNDYTEWVKKTGPIGVTPSGDWSKLRGGY